MYNQPLYPHHGSILIRAIVRPKNPQGFITGEIIHKDSCTFAIDSNTEEECKKDTEDLFNFLKEAYNEWNKKRLNVPIVASH